MGQSFKPFFSLFLPKLVQFVTFSVKIVLNRVNRFFTLCVIIVSPVFPVSEVVRIIAPVGAKSHSELSVTCTVSFLGFGVSGIGAVKLAVVGLGPSEFFVFRVVSEIDIQTLVTSGQVSASFVGIVNSLTGLGSVLSAADR